MRCALARAALIEQNDSVNSGVKELAVPAIASAARAT
jgi:hypothetical protein